MSGARPFRLSLLFAGLLACASVLGAATGGFSSTLSADERKAAGIDRLTADETAAFDALVAGDIAQARQAKSSTIAGSLPSRHPAERLHAAGLDRLSAAQLATLDAFIAESLLARPAPRARPRLGSDDVIVEKRKLEVHGGFSFTYGWAGGGRNFRDTSAWTSVYDPDTGLGIAVGLGHFSGDVLSPYEGYDPYYDGYAYGGSGTINTQSAVVSLDRPYGSIALGFSQSSGERSFGSWGSARRSDFSGRRR